MKSFVVLLGVALTAYFFYADDQASALLMKTRWIPCRAPAGHAVAEPGVKRDVLDDLSLV